MNADTVSEIISVIMDCLEESLNTVIIVTEKKLRYMLYVCLAFLAFAVVAKIFEIPVFMTWQIPATACAILVGVLSMNHWNLKTITEFKEKLGGIRDGRR